ncbi:MAG: tRNA (N6-threonylcarbamoyladenosine(37)-N6)-methyltransferase TrmO [Bulleidia sp.]
MELVPVAVIHSDFGERIGIPRETEVVHELPGTIVLLPEYRKPGILKGLSDYSHLWVIWGFSESSGWSPTVYPPRYGRKIERGVFATRSPNRPNPIAMTAVKIVCVDEDAYTIQVLGADMMNGSPVFDLKPYDPESDCLTEASRNLSDAVHQKLKVEFSSEAEARVPEEKRALLTAVLAEDPRPFSKRGSGKACMLNYAGMEIRYCVKQEKILTVLDIS